MKAAITGKWAGFYIQEFPTHDSYMGQVEFELNVRAYEDGFRGECYDIDLNNERQKASVVGFTEGTLVSFIKQYENTQWYDAETEEIWTEEGYPHPEIHYYGRFSELEHRYEGVWEIVLSVKKSGDGFVEEISSGIWEMRKIEEDSVR